LFLDIGNAGDFADDWKSAAMEAVAHNRANAVNLDTKSIIENILTTVNLLKPQPALTCSSPLTNPPHLIYHPNNTFEHSTPADNSGSFSMPLLQVQDGVQEEQQLDPNAGVKAAFAQLLSQQDRNTMLGQESVVQNQSEAVHEGRSYPETNYEYKRGMTSVDYQHGHVQPGDEYPGGGGVSEYPPSGMSVAGQTLSEGHGDRQHKERTPKRSSTSKESRPTRSVRQASSGEDKKLEMEGYYEEFEASLDNVSAAVDESNNWDTAILSPAFKKPGFKIADALTAEQTEDT